MNARKQIIDEEYDQWIKELEKGLRKTARGGYYTIAHNPEKNLIYGFEHHNSSDSNEKIYNGEHKKLKTIKPWEASENPEEFEEEIEYWIHELDCEEIKR